MQVVFLMNLKNVKTMGLKYLNTCAFPLCTYTHGAYLVLRSWISLPKSKIYTSLNPANYCRVCTGVQQDAQGTAVFSEFTYMLYIILLLGTFIYFIFETRAQIYAYIKYLHSFSLSLSFSHSHSLSCFRIRF